MSKNAQDWYPRGAVEFDDDHPAAGPGKRVAKLPRAGGGEDVVQVHCKKVEKADEVVLIFCACCVDDDGNELTRQTPNGPVAIECPEYHYTISKSLIADGSKDVDTEISDKTNVILGRMQNFLGAMRSWDAAPAAPEPDTEAYDRRIAELEAEVEQLRRQPPEEN